MEKIRKKNVKPPAPALQIAFPEKLEFWKVADLHPYDRNPKIHPAAQIEKIVQSIINFGFNNPIRISPKFGIVAGHGTYAAARKMGLETVPVIQLKHLTPIQAQAYMIADNRIAQDGRWDDEILSGILWELEASYKDLTVTGLDVKEIDHLIEMAGLRAGENADIGTAGATPPGGPAPETAEDAWQLAPSICKLGDLWQLGRHVLYCGDATKPGIKALFGAHEVNLFLSDPPYMIKYDDKIKTYNEVLKSGERLETGIDNDDLADPTPFFQSLIESAPLATYNSIYIFMSFFAMDQLKAAGAAAGLTFHQWLIWYKNNHSMTRTDYKYIHDYIYYGWLGKHKFYGGFSTTVLPFPKVMNCTLHPTMKPVALCEYLIKNSSKRNEIVYDPCAGSGTTLIAAENTGRRSLVADIKPIYCDAMIERWRLQTGGKPKKING